MVVLPEWLPYFQESWKPELAGNRFPDADLVGIACTAWNPVDNEAERARGLYLNTNLAGSFILNRDSGLAQ
jgi:hypothetical protein